MCSSETQKDILKREINSWTWLASECSLKIEIIKYFKSWVFDDGRFRENSWRRWARQTRKLWDVTRRDAVQLYLPAQKSVKLRLDIEQVLLPSCVMRMTWIVDYPSWLWKERWTPQECAKELIFVDWARHQDVMMVYYRNFMQIFWSWYRNIEDLSNSCLSIDAMPWGRFYF